MAFARQPSLKEGGFHLGAGLYDHGYVEDVERTTPTAS